MTHSRELLYDVIDSTGCSVLCALNLLSKSSFDVSAAISLYNSSSYDVSEYADLYDTHSDNFSVLLDTLNTSSSEWNQALHLNDSPSTELPLKETFLSIAQSLSCPPSSFSSSLSSLVALYSAFSSSLDSDLDVGLDVFSNHSVELAQNDDVISEKSIISSDDDIITDRDSPENFELNFARLDDGENSESAVIVSHQNFNENIYEKREESDCDQSKLIAVRSDSDDDLFIDVDTFNNLSTIQGVDDDTQAVTFDSTDQSFSTDDDDLSIDVDVFNNLSINQQVKIDQSNVVVDDSTADTEEKPVIVQSFESNLIDFIRESDLIEEELSDEPSDCSDSQEFVDDVSIKENFRQNIPVCDVADFETNHSSQNLNFNEIFENSRQTIEFTSGILNENLVDDTLTEQITASLHQIQSNHDTFVDSQSFVESRDCELLIEESTIVKHETSELIGSDSHLIDHPYDDVFLPVQNQNLDLSLSEPEIVEILDQKLPPIFEILPRISKLNSTIKTLSIALKAFNSSSIINHRYFYNNLLLNPEEIPDIATELDYNGRYSSNQNVDSQLSRLSYVLESLTATRRNILAKISYLLRNRALSKDTIASLTLECVDL
ncbi:hypothetical protein RCL1_008357 [Eukaryota sp. TZLM3-RCL]